jgi:elongation factor G
MKEYPTDRLRNVALVSHGGGGKTTLAEALLFATGGVNRMGKVEEGNTLSDFEDEEVRRRLSLSATVMPVEFRDHKVNLLDTPGYTDFTGEVISALRVADGAVVLIDSVAGVEVGTELVWDYCNTFELPRLVVISKMDRENADFRRALEAAGRLPTDMGLIPIQIPMGEAGGFHGVIDLLAMKARPRDGKEEQDIPPDLLSAAQEARVAVIEAAAEGEDALLEKYLDGQELTAEEIGRGFQKAVWSRKVAPVLVAAGNSAAGALPLLETILRLLPGPADSRPARAQGKSGEEALPATDSGPLAAYAWKTTADPFVGKLTYLRIYSGTLHSDSRVWNHTKSAEERLGTLHVQRGKEQIAVQQLHAGDIGTVAKLGATGTGDSLGDKGHPLAFSKPDYPNALFSVAVLPKTQADSAKMGPSLTRLSEEDPTLSWHQEPSTNQTILQGMGDQHIDVAIRRAESKLQVGLLTETPRVPYKETITRAGRSQYRHKKQTGGSGQFAEVHMRVEPLAEGDFEFENAVFGGAISSSFMPAIEKGVRGVMKQGVLAGYPIQKVKVAVTDGKEHPVDSKAVAFEAAGREAFKLAVRDAGAVLLEPIMDVRVVVPEDHMGDVLGDLNTRRARVQGMETERGRSVVTATVPLAEMLRYTSELRSITGGRGVFNMSLRAYEVVPAHVAEGIIAARQKESGKPEAD